MVIAASSFYEPSSLTSFQYSRLVSVLEIPYISTLCSIGRGEGVQSGSSWMSRTSTEKDL